MEFTREAWENAPEGATLECMWLKYWYSAHLVGYTSDGRPVIERSLDGMVSVFGPHQLRIILPKRKVTVQLWRGETGAEFGTVSHPSPMPSWTLLGEHTFEIEGK